MPKVYDSPKGTLIVRTKGGKPSKAAQAHMKRQTAQAKTILKRIKARRGK